VLKTATEHPQLALAAARLMAARLRRCAQLVESLSLREVGQRVASIILAQAKSGGTKSDDGVKLRLALTQNQLAARVGTVREVVARTLTRLGEDGLIIHKGKEILIPDIRALAAYADEKLS
jgi:CRP/FNR family transcriptional regulator